MKTNIQPEGRFLTIAGREIHIITKGHKQNGPVLFFLHGNSETALNWQEVWANLPVNAHCVAMDLPGHGFSDRDWHVAHTSTYHANLAGQVLTALGITQAVWIGHSQGGGICLTAALQERARVQGIVLVASVGVPFAKDDIRRGWSRVIPSRPQRWFSWFLQVPPGSTIRNRLLHIGSAAVMQPVPLPQPLDQPEWQRDFMLWGRPSQIIAAAEDMRFLGPSIGEIYDSYEQIDVPCEVVSALGDQLVPPAVGQLLAGRIPQAQLSEIPHAGHMLIRSHPNTVVNAIERMINRVDASAPKIACSRPTPNPDNLLQ